MNDLGQQRFSLPRDWQWTTMGEVCSTPQYGYTTKASPEGDLHLLRTTDITSGRINWETVPYCTDDPDSPAKYLLEDGDIVISRAGSVGVSHLVKVPRRAVFASYLIRFRPFIDRLFFTYFLGSPFYWNAITEKQLGIAVPNVNASKLKAVELPLPPLVEQQAVVAKIEALFSELDKGVEQLEAVRAQLKRYRQSVLKAAFEGKLTAAWRAEQQAAGKLSTAGELLDQIKAEREARYQQQLADWQQAAADWEANGGKDSGQKKPRKPGKPSGPEVLRQERRASLPVLPDGWTWCRTMAMAEVSGGLTKNQRRSGLPLKLPYLRVANVYADRLELSDVKELRVTRAERDKTLLVAGDILFVEGNGSPDQIGRVALWDGSISPCLHQNHLIRCRLVVEEMAKFALHWFLSPAGRQLIMREASSTSGLHTLSITKVSSLSVPLASTEEQATIVQEIESRLSVLDELQKAVDQGLAQAQALRQSILKKAFEGRLLSADELAAVRNDPNYEPAEQLLERIRAEREQSDGAAPKGTRKAAAAKSAPRPKAPRGVRYRQAAFAAYAVQRLSKRETFGRVQQMKFLYLVPHLLAQESHIHARREAAGPYDPAIHKIEHLAKTHGWFTVSQHGSRYVYRPGPNIADACKFAREKFGDKVARVDWLLDQFAHMDTEQAELLATTFAVWNDHLIDGHKPSEKEIVQGVHGWHPTKAEKFPPDRIRECIEWMRKKEFAPTGMRPRTSEV